MLNEQSRDDGNGTRRAAVVVPVRRLLQLPRFKFHFEDRRAKEKWPPPFIGVEKFRPSRDGTSDFLQVLHVESAARETLSFDELFQLNRPDCRSFADHCFVTERHVFLIGCTQYFYYFY